MKANEAPEKIYVALNELTEDGHTLVLDHRVDYPICTEYTHTDAFIEKASKWIEENIKKWYENIKVHGFRGMTPLMITEFKKYMEE